MLNQKSFIMLENPPATLFATLELLVVNKFLFSIY